MNSLHVKTGDTAVVLSGKEKGKRGKVIKVMPKKGMVVLEGVNFVTRHQKPTRQNIDAVLLADRCKRLQLFLRVDHAGRVGRRVQHENRRMLGDIVLRQLSGFLPHAVQPGGDRIGVLYQRSRASRL